MKQCRGREDISARTRLVFHLPLSVSLSYSHSRSHSLCFIKTCPVSGSQLRTLTINFSTHSELELALLFSHGIWSFLKFPWVGFLNLFSGVYGFQRKTLDLRWVSVLFSFERWKSAAVILKLKSMGKKLSWWTWYFSALPKLYPKYRLFSLFHSV